MAPQYIANQSAFKLTENLKIFVLLFDHPTISQVTWTLSFELYFYILFFLIIFNKNFKYLIFFIILLTILNLVNINLFEKSYFQKYLISPLILEFFLGVAIVFISNNVVKKNVVGVSFLLILSIFFFIYIDYLSNNNLIVINKHNRVLSFGLASFLLILSLVLLEKFNAIKSPKTLIIIGDSSYVLYLIHSVILSFLDNQIILSGKFVIINQQISTILACCFIIILSVIIHLLVEKPMIKCLNNSYIKAVS